jgi:hypothetical protein
MLQIHLLLTICVLIVHLIGLALAVNLVVKDYTVSRVGSVLGLCLLGFFSEHFVGMGPRLAWLPWSAPLAVGMIVWQRDLLRKNLSVELWFAAGFFYCLAWRYAFPDIDLHSEKMPNLVFIESYLTGDRLPALDRWLPPYRASFYYSFQHYGAALMGRWLALSPGVSYHLAYCTISGLLAAGVAGVAARFSLAKMAQTLLVAALLVGGSGAVLSAFILSERVPNPLDCVRFVGGTLDHGNLNATGLAVSKWVHQTGVEARDEPLETLSFVLSNGDYHPPLTGHWLLVFSILLIATLENGAAGRQRKILAGCLAATLPVVFISNAWVLPTQIFLVVGWFIYRMARGERPLALAGLIGLGAGAILSYPYLAEFTRQNSMSYAAIRWTQPIDRTPLIA